MNRKRSEADVVSKAIFPSVYKIVLWTSVFGNYE